MCLAAADLVATLAHFASPPGPERDHRDHQDNRDGAGGPRRPIRSPGRLGRLASRSRAESTGITRAVDSSLERREVKPVTVVLVVSVVPRCHST